MTDPELRIVLAQLDFAVGALEANAERIVEAAAEARERHRADLVAFPELCLTGYPLDDLLLRPALHEQVERCLDRICARTRGIHLLVGHPERDEDALFNACTLLHNGRRLFRYRKRHLPNYGVFDEQRHFRPGERSGSIRIGGIRCAFGICEDIWHPGPAREAREAGAELLIDVNASPFHVGKAAERIRHLRDRCREQEIAAAYVNLVGGQDELVFDGASFAMDAQGELCLQAPWFREGLFALECRRENGALRLASSCPHEPLAETEAIYRALTLGVRDYVRKSAAAGAMVGVSGGVDSALTLCVAADALGPERVGALLMPSRHTADMSVEDARALAESLGVEHRTISIEPMFQAFCAALQASPAAGEEETEDTTLENLQARCRGVLLMAYSNRTGRLVLATGNKSEAAVGYATLYGDTAGAYAPLKDVFKTRVYELARWRNGARGPIPQRILERAPSAELRPNQADEDSLPPYSVLDPILQRYLERDQSPAEIVKAGYDETTVRRVAALVDRSEYKRRQMAPGARVSQRSFGRERRYPLCSAYRE